MIFSRRTLLSLGAGAALVGGMGASPAEAALRMRLERSIYLYNPHTGEFLRTVYWQDGHYQPTALRQVNRILRDHYSGDVHSMEPRVIDLLSVIQHKFGVQKPIHVISGYRSPKTNAFLRRHSDGVAAHSLHMEGKAVDIRIEGASIEHLGRAARSLRLGGVGQYPASGFVHVDVGRVRTW